MAIDLKYTMSDWEFEKTINSAASFVEEGQLVVRSFNSTTGEEEAAVGSETGSLVVLGFAKLDTISPAATRVYTETTEVPATADGSGDYKVTLGHTLVTAAIDTDGDVAVYDKTNSAWLAVGAAIASGVFTLFNAASGILEFHADEAGIEIDVYARVTMTARERDQMYQQRHVNSNAMDDLEKIGVISGTGKIRTDQYDVSVGDWSSATLETGALGVITDSAGGGTNIASYVRVTKVPSVEDPFLELEFNLPMSS